MTFGVEQSPPEPERPDAAPGRRGRRVPRLPATPPIVLGLLVLVQWVAVLGFVLVVQHNGWLFYQGGDQTFFYTVSWAISGGLIPASQIGYGWSYLLSPIALAFGPNLLDALPVLVLVQTLVLLPLALYCVYAIAGNIGGRRLGYVAAVAWVAVPFAVIPLWDSSYHPKYVEQFLPQAFGMTGLGDFPSMVCLLVAALFCVRALDTRDLLDAALAGCAAGFAIGIKPANALFLAGPVLAFAAARRLREGLGFGAGLLPLLLTLALWKYRGLGHLPIVTPNPEAVAVDGRLAASIGSLPAGVELDRYVDIDWSRLGENYVDLRGVFWGLPLLQSLPLLGFFAATRRSWPKAFLLGGWLGAFLIVKGSSDQATVDAGTLLRLFMPGFPPLLILSALVPMLVVGSRISKWTPIRPAPVRRRYAAIAVAAFCLVPLLLFIVLPPLRAHTVVKYYAEGVMVPVDGDFTVDVRRGDEGVLVSWRAPSSPGVRAFYRVFRSRPIVPAPDPALPPGRDGIRCHEQPASGYTEAVDCALEMSLVGVTRASRFVDRPPAGRWVYRVGLAANWLDDTDAGNVVLLSKPGRLPAQS